MFETVERRKAFLWCGVCLQDMMFVGRTRRYAACPKFSRTIAQVVAHQGSAVPPLSKTGAFGSDSTLMKGRGWGCSSSTCAARPFIHCLACSNATGLSFSGTGFAKGFRVERNLPEYNGRIHTCLTNTRSTAGWDADTSGDGTLLGVCR